MTPVEIALAAVALYLAVGALVATLFVTIGVARVDPAARKAPVAFRLLIWPGCCALWPVILRWTLSTAHRRAEPHP